VEEMDWPMISVGEFRFEKGMANLEISFVGQDLGNIEVKSVFLKKLK
jgi:hypothetical protein